MTTQNLAALFVALDLADALRDQLGQMAQDLLLLDNHAVGGGIPRSEGYARA